MIHGLIGAVQPLQKCVHVRSDTRLSQLKQRVGTQCYRNCKKLIIGKVNGHLSCNESSH